jgi:hypothetical protein
MRKVLALAAIVLWAGPVAAAEQVVQVNVNYSLQASLPGGTAADFIAEEQKMKRAMYERTTRECAELLATVALTCTIAAINVSTQITQNYGQVPTLYVNTSVSMQVKLK